MTGAESLLYKHTTNHGSAQDTFAEQDRIENLFNCLSIDWKNIQDQSSTLVPSLPNFTHVRNHTFIIMIYSQNLIIKHLSTIACLSSSLALIYWFWNIWPKGKKAQAELLKKWSSDQKNKLWASRHRKTHKTQGLKTPIPICQALKRKVVLVSWRPWNNLGFEFRGVELKVD